MNKPIYLDYHSTTPVDSRVISKMIEYMNTHFGNPGSNISYSYGIDAENGIEIAKGNISQLINCSPKEIIFTSGATESINLSILGTIKKNYSTKQKIGLLPIEHKAVLSVCEHLEKNENCELIYLKIDSKGILDLDDLEEKCQSGLSLICVMAVNNEIGNIYPIEKIGQLADKYEIPFFCDATQAVGKIKVDFENWKVDFLAFSAHKMYGPKGSGALIIKKGRSIEPLMFGGGQQKSIRPGTLNVPGVVALGESCYLRNSEMQEDEAEIYKKREKLFSLLKFEIPNVVINGDLNNKIAGNLNMSFPGIPNNMLVSRLRKKVALSTGSACTSGVEEQSYVLRALEIPQEIIESSVRICIGKFTSYQEIEESAQFIVEEIKKINSLLYLS